MCSVVAPMSHHTDSVLCLVLCCLYSSFGYFFFLLFLLFLLFLGTLSPILQVTMATAHSWTSCIRCPFSTPDRKNSITCAIFHHFAILLFSSNFAEKFLHRSCAHLLLFFAVFWNYFVLAFLLFSAIFSHPLHKAPKTSRSRWGVRVGLCVAQVQAVGAERPTLGCGE